MRFERKQSALPRVGHICIWLVIAALPAAAADLYVGDGEPGSYATIQEAVDAANPGDTVYVTPGEYFEHLDVDKALNLLGLEPAAVDGGGAGTILTLRASDILVSGLTFANGDEGIRVAPDYGERLENVEVRGNVLVDNVRGLYLYRSWGWLSASTVADNLIQDNSWGISTAGSTYYAGTLSDITFAGNTIVDNVTGMSLGQRATSNRVYNNNFIDNGTNAEDAT